MSISIETARAIVEAHERIDEIENAVRIFDAEKRVAGISFYDGHDNLFVPLHRPVAIEALNHELVAARAELDEAKQKAVDELK